MAPSLFARLQQLLQPILIAYIVWKYYKKNQTLKCKPNDKPCADEYFSVSYNEARNKFLEFSQKIKKANTYSLPLDDDNALYTDITILNEESHSNHLLLHISGLHGVEGFAGSGIQTYLLDQFSKGSLTFDADENDPPIVLFVHALNPFGFNQSRRANENNVDLARNLKTKSEWDSMSKKGPNAFHYNDVSDLLNPNLYLTQVSTFMDAYIPAKLQPYAINIYAKWSYISIPFRGLFHISKYGLQSIKVAAAVGQIHKASGYQYIGRDKVERSHQILKDFLAQKFEQHPKWKTQIDKVTMIDIHSGDDSYGIDKLLTTKAAYANKLKRLLLEYDDKDLIQSLNSAQNANDPQFLGGIYDDVTGLSMGYGDYIASLTDNQDMDLLPFAAEFGCNHRLETVVMTQILENAWFQEYKQCCLEEDNVNDGSKEIMKQIVNKAGGWLRDVFYVQEPNWKKFLVRRGLRVFDVCWNR